MKYTNIGSGVVAGLCFCGAIWMCEFKVVVGGKVVFKDAVYAKVDGGNVVVKSILGESKEFENCRIMEVDVNSERLVLASTKGGQPAREVPRSFY